MSVRIIQFLTVRFPCSVHFSLRASAKPHRNLKIISPHQRFAVSRRFISCGSRQPFLVLSFLFLSQNPFVYNSWRRGSYPSLPLSSAAGNSARTVRPRICINIGEVCVGLLTKSRDRGSVGISTGAQNPYQWHAVPHNVCPAYAGNNSSSRRSRRSHRRTGRL